LKFWQDLRRRKIYRLIGIYVVSAWLAIQVASTFFPAWAIPDTALRFLIIAAAMGFPVALVFGWFFDITADGIVRTASATESDTADLALRRPDYLILSALALTAVAILVGSFDKVRQATDGTVTTTESIEKPANSIAILPFVNMNKDVDTEYFSDGITEEILHHLSSLKTLRVMGRTSSFAFKNSDIGLPRLSDILQVKYLLQGSVRRDRDQVRVTASLVDDSGYQVWSQTFDRKLEGIFAIQTEIADMVAGQLVRQIGRSSDTASRVTENLDAYQEYLLGRDYLNHRGVDWKVNATAAFEKSIELDPEFALPYAGLAVATSIGQRYSSVPENLANAQAQVDRALELQPELAEAHAAQGLILFVGQNPNFAAAEAALRRAIDLDPNLVIAYNWLSTTVSSQGRSEEGQAIRESGLAIDPLNPVINTNVAARYSSRGDFRRAEKLLLRLMDLPDPPSMAYWGLESLYYAYGRLDDALDWTKRIVRAHGPESRNNPYGVLAIIYEHLGMSSDSDYWFDKLVDDDADAFQILVRKSYILKLRGDYEGTKELLDKASQHGEINYRELSIFAAQVVGALNISVGDVESGIEILESVIDVDAPISTTSGGGVGALDFLQLLAYGHRQIGNDARATMILQKVQETFEYWSADGESQNPRTMEKLALNQAMLGDTQQALATLESAASLGWRNYFFVLNDQRWQETMELPEFKSLMSWVKADIDRQRERIEAIELKEDFRAYVEAWDTSGQM
jgi:TolB-like protein/Flp pilus assembly protein TadD